jgi:hypothetical protein
MNNRLIRPHPRRPLPPKNNRSALGPIKKPSFQKNIKIMKTTDDSNN